MISPKQYDALEALEAAADGNGIVPMAAIAQLHGKTFNALVRNGLVKVLSSGGVQLLADDNAGKVTTRSMDRYRLRYGRG